MVEDFIRPHLSHAGLTPPALALWGGLECTIARVGELFRNQIQETGHHERGADLNAIASLGIRTVRYPVLWETIAPTDPTRCDWSWHDRRLQDLHTLGIMPIAGLVHHGSGPCYTNLLDTRFPQLVAAHAQQVAARYPWITHFTPINEPLTTARFSGLYGHWYPHGRSVDMFLRTLVNQCRAIVLSMAAIRRITPQAQLVQTEDLGKTFSSPDLQYQAEYENQRRWLSFDLLCGRVDIHHPWYGQFITAGIDSHALGFFQDHRCIPDIMGINHYLTSERYLDHRGNQYPTQHHASNQLEEYADVEAVRIDFGVSGTTGPGPRLLEAWSRYQVPLAITEVHHGCSREEQIRWLMEVWNAGISAQALGVDLRAVTVWAMFGCVDWNTLLTQKNGFYESGVFDVRSRPPRPTLLATASHALATTGTFDHPVLQQPGWWHRHERYYAAPPDKTAGTSPLISTPRRIVITGASGTLGQAFARICRQRGLDFAILRRTDMDIGDTVSVTAALARTRPWAIINAAGYVRVGQAEKEMDRCFRENTVGAAILATACARLDIAYVTFSSDLVFDGALGRSYVESDAVCPQSVYGSSKATAERLVARAWPPSLVVRTSAFFGPWDQYNFVCDVIQQLRSGRTTHASGHVMVSPTYVPDLVHAVLDLLIDGAGGIWHLANQGLVSWHELALRVAKAAGVNTQSLQCVGQDMPAVITGLSSERGLMLPPLDDAISRYVREAFG